MGPTLPVPTNSVPTVVFYRRESLCRQLIAVPTAVEAVPTGAYADHSVPTVAVGIDCADGNEAYADGLLPSAQMDFPVVLATTERRGRRRKIFSFPLVRAKKQKEIEAPTFSQGTN